MTNNYQFSILLFSENVPGVTNGKSFFNIFSNEKLLNDKNFKSISGSSFYRYSHVLGLTMIINSVLNVF